MKIAVLNEFSQAPKNGIILKELKSVVEPMGHQVFNAAMEVPLTDQDVPEAYTQENPRLTYLHLGIMSALLLNSGAVDFVVTGCGTAQGALMSLNMYPGVVCGYCIEPTDAYLFLQINNGNALLQSLFLTPPISAKEHIVPPVKTSSIFSIFTPQ